MENKLELILSATLTFSKFMLFSENQFSEILGLYSINALLIGTL
jgi:hypothetical protein